MNKYRPITQLVIFMVSICKKNTSVKLKGMVVPTFLYKDKIVKWQERKMNFN